MNKPTLNNLVDAIRAGVIKQPNGVELEAQPRKIGGHYIANIPGLTEQRLVELRGAIVTATGDPHALGEMKLYASGGWRMTFTWSHEGTQHRYEATMPPEKLASILDRDEDSVWTTWATEALEFVRLHRGGWEGEKMPTMTQRIVAGADAAIALAAHVASKPAVRKDPAEGDADEFEKREP